MPVEVFDLEEFKKIVKGAIECRVYRDQKKGIAKLKAKTKRKLVTIKVPLNELNNILSQLECKNLVEIA